ncbi:MAG: hypothetical protein RRZ64_04365 [Rikenellaceae bacterium]
MAGISDNILESIRRRVIDMTRDIVLLKNENKSLKNENIELKQELKELKIIVKQARTADGLTKMLSKKNAKKWLNDILEDIEDCKKIINS